MTRYHLIALSVLAGLSGTSNSHAEAIAEDKSNEIEEITVVGRSVSYANNAASDDMQKQQANLSSVLAVVDNLPGVLINEVDTHADALSVWASLKIVSENEVYVIKGFESFPLLTTRCYH
jgi:hypothetical protein